MFVRTARVVSKAASSLRSSARQVASSSSSASARVKPRRSAHSSSNRRQQYTTKPSSAPRQAGKVVAMTSIGISLDATLSANELESKSGSLASRPVAVPAPRSPAPAPHSLGCSAVKPSTSPPFSLLDFLRKSPWVPHPTPDKENSSGRSSGHARVGSGGSPARHSPVPIPPAIPSSAVAGIAPVRTSSGSSRSLAVISRASLAASSSSLSSSAASSSPLNIPPPSARPSPSSVSRPVAIPQPSASSSRSRHSHSNAHGHGHAQAAAFPSPSPSRDDEPDAVGSGSGSGTDDSESITSPPAPLAATGLSPALAPQHLLQPLPQQQQQQFIDEVDHDVAVELASSFSDDEDFEPLPHEDDDTAEPVQLQPSHHQQQQQSHGVPSSSATAADAHRMFGTDLQLNSAPSAAVGEDTDSDGEYDAAAESARRRAAKKQATRLALQQEEEPPVSGDDEVVHALRMVRITEEAAKLSMQMPELKSAFDSFCKKISPSGRLVLVREDFQNPDRWQALGHFLGACPDITALRLQGMEITKDEAAALGKGVLKSIRHITFCGNNIGLNEGALDIIVAVLLLCEYLESAAIVHNSVSDTQVPLIARLITEHSSLASLDLCWNGVGDDGASQLALAFRRLRMSLSKIDLSYNRIGALGLRNLNKAQNEIRRTGRPFHVNLSGNNGIREFLRRKADRAFSHGQPRSLAPAAHLPRGLFNWQLQAQAQANREAAEAWERGGGGGNNAGLSGAVGGGGVPSGVPGLGRMQTPVVGGLGGFGGFLGLNSFSSFGFAGRRRPPAQVGVRRYRR